MKNTPQLGGNIGGSVVKDLEPPTVKLPGVSIGGKSGKKSKSSSSSSSSDEEKDKVPALGLTGAIPGQDLF